MKYFILIVLTFTSLSSALFSQDNNFRILHHFTGGSNDGGWTALTRLIKSGSGLYGMSAEGGSSNSGTIYKINQDGSDFKVLHSFVSPTDDGTRPYGSLILSGSNFYGFAGSEKSNYSGTFFSIDTNGSSYKVIHRFSGSEGKWAYDTPLLSDSIFYGMTTYGGNNTQSGWKGGGTIFKMNFNGTDFQLLHTFNGGNSDGYGPHGSLIQSGNALFGTTLVGGGNNSGTIFKINADGTEFQLLHTFAGGANDGSSPYGTTLVQSGSALFGMTQNSGNSDKGTIFKINTNGSDFTLLHSFSASTNDGQTPMCGTLVLSESALYGMTTYGGANNFGCIFSINTDGSDFNILYSFNRSDGKLPYGSLMVSGPTLYGITSEGGENNLGVIFALDLHSNTQETVKDIDGNIYNTVTIGEQVWMVENLKTTKYRNGDPIETITSPTLNYSSELTPKYQWAYDGDENNVEVYGRLYTWYAATDNRGIVPVGWHVPSSDEWQALIDYLGGAEAAHGKLKETGTTHWDTPNSDATNESGFTGVPGGSHWAEGGFDSKGMGGHYWSTSAVNSNDAQRLLLNYEFLSEQAVLNSGDKKIGWSVRCVKDVTTDLGDSKNGNQIPEKMQLNQNYPNPFNPSTIIKYQLSENNNIKLKIYDTLGREIKTLINAFQAAGEYSIKWNGTDNSNNPVSSGVYFYSLTSDASIVQKKMILMR